MIPLPPISYKSSLSLGTKFANRHSVPVYGFVVYLDLTMNLFIT